MALSKLQQYFSNAEETSAATSANACKARRGAGLWHFQNFSNTSAMLKKLQQQLQQMLVKLVVVRVYGTFKTSAETSAENFGKKISGKSA